MPKKAKRKNIPRVFSKKAIKEAIHREGNQIPDSLVKELQQLLMDKVKRKQLANELRVAYVPESFIQENLFEELTRGLNILLENSGRKRINKKDIKKIDRLQYILGGP